MAARPYPYLAPQTPTGTVTFPRDLAELVRRVFVPFTSPSAHPDVVSALAVFHEAINGRPIRAEVTMDLAQASLIRNVYLPSNPNKLRHSKQLAKIGVALQDARTAAAKFIAIVEMGTYQGG